MARIRIRTTPRVVRRDEQGRFSATGRRETIRVPVAHPPGDLPTWVVLDDGTRLRTTGRAGRASLNLFQALLDRGLTFPTAVTLHHGKQAYETGLMPAAWVAPPPTPRPPPLPAPPARIPREPPVALRPRPPERRRAPVRKAPQYRVVTIRRDRLGKFNARGRTVQRVRVPIKKGRR